MYLFQSIMYQWKSIRIQSHLHEINKCRILYWRECSKPCLHQGTNDYLSFSVTHSLLQYTSCHRAKTHVTSRLFLSIWNTVGTKITWNLVWAQKHETQKKACKLINVLQSLVQFTRCHHTVWNMSHKQDYFIRIKYSRHPNYLYMKFVPSTKYTRPRKKSALHSLLQYRDVTALRQMSHKQDYFITMEYSRYSKHDLSIYSTPKSVQILAGLNLSHIDTVGKTDREIFFFK